jgi:hypothetical protein
MLFIEHAFDPTIITLADEGDAPLQQDVIFNVAGYGFVNQPEPPRVYRRRS